ncbi:MAG: DUF1062 domain-containing protein [Mobilitalea sp.]
MSYKRKFEYRIIPEESYFILRNCPTCGCKSVFINSNNFRVNANGNRIDVWLIYQCEKCKHTYNLTIHERLRPQDISPEHYKKFMENNIDFAVVYGTDKSVFAKNKAEIDYNNIKYQINFLNSIGTAKDDPIRFQSGDLLIIENPFELKIRTDKIVAELLRITRSKEKQLEKTETILIKNNSIERKIEIRIQGDFNYE